MSDLSSEIALVASDAISEFGLPSTFSKTFNSVAGPVTTQYVANVVVSERVDSTLPGSNLVIGDWKCLAETSESYAFGDRVTMPVIGRLVIVDIEPIMLAGQAVAIWIWLRSG